MIVPNVWKNKKYSTPPTRYTLTGCLPTDTNQEAALKNLMLPSHVFQSCCRLLAVAICILSMFGTAVWVSGKVHDPSALGCTQAMMMITMLMIMMTVMVIVMLILTMTTATMRMRMRMRIIMFIMIVYHSTNIESLPTVYGKNHCLNWMMGSFTYIYIYIIYDVCIYYCKLSMFSNV